MVDLEIEVMQRMLFINSRSEEISVELKSKICCCTKLLNDFADKVDTIKKESE
jgi:hypothetical protein